MRTISANFRALALGFVTALLLSTAATAAEVRVMISGGLAEAYKALVPEFEKATGHTVLTARGPSMGTTPSAIPVRLERGEPADVLIMVGYALDGLAKQGKVVAGSSIDLVKSPIGVAVKSGTPKPDISSADALKRALLAAKSIAYSDSASGVYISTEMFPKLGIADDMKGKARAIPAEPVGRGGGARRRRDRLPADQRIAAGRRRRHDRAVAAGVAEDHGVFGRHRHGFQGARRRQGADQIPRFAGGTGHDDQDRPGADRGGGDELVSRMRPHPEEPRVFARRLEGWPRVHGLHPSFETHRFAMLLRMRLAVVAKQGISQPGWSEAQSRLGIIITSFASGSDGPSSPFSS